MKEEIEKKYNPVCKQTNGWCECHIGDNSCSLTCPVCSQAKSITTKVTKGKKVISIEF